MNNSDFDIFINAEFLDTKTGTPILNLSPDEITSEHEPYEHEYPTLSLDPILEIDFNSEIPNWILDYFNMQEPEECFVEIPIMVQCRTHKKKRINKKWRKRYGAVIRYEKRRAKKIEIKAGDLYAYAHCK